MGGFEVDMSPVYRLASELGKASFDASNKARQVTLATAARIVADAKTLSPVDTGNLRSSISSSNVSTGTVTEVEIGPTADYGGYVEYGTSRMGPRPYMGMAAARNEAAYAAAMTELGAKLL